MKIAITPLGAPGKWHIARLPAGETKGLPGSHIIDTEGGEAGFEKLIRLGRRLLDQWTRAATGIEPMSWHDKDAVGQLLRALREIGPTLPLFDKEAVMAKTRKTPAPIEEIDEVPPEEQAQEQQEVPAPKKKAAKPAPAKEKAAKAAPAKEKAAKPGPKGVGVIAVIQHLMERKTGASVDEMVAALAEKFPDRSVEGMTSTVRIQVNRLPKKLGREVEKSTSEKRGGLVYRMLPATA